MIVGIVIILAFVIAGLLLGLNIAIPYSYSQYVAVAILACLDSVFGAIAASTERRFKMNVFLSGFFGNAIIAMFLVYIGSRLNVDIYLAAVIVFSGRMLNNFSVIRRIFVDNLEKKKSNKTSELNDELIEDKNEVIEIKDVVVKKSNKNTVSHNSKIKSKK